MSILKKADIGIIGMAVMGQNLALNIESRGYTVAVYNRTQSRLAELMQTIGSNKNLVPATSIAEFVSSLSRPRKILLMVQAGTAVDRVISDLQPYLEPNDILIDGGNSYFIDTIRRTKEANNINLRYIGTGISGGEEGALTGPSIMPGGNREAFDEIEPMLNSIAAKVKGDSCCTYIGANGAGHYVKMVHNGIEYGDMQLISEAYAFMKLALGMDHSAMQTIFAEWNRGELDSYLISITADILSKIDSVTGLPMVEVILDQAGQKGTGRWTSESALGLGVPAPTIAEAVFARCMSALKDERVAASVQLKGPEVSFSGDSERLLSALKKALYASKICSYAQGFSLMRAAAKEYHWQLDYGAIAMIWRGGCIIRAKFLTKIKDAFQRNDSLANLLLDPYFTDIIHGSQHEWRKIIATATTMGIPVPAFSAALNYYDSYRSATLPANMIQAQRDYFGAHTYQRIDRKGVFHTQWMAGNPPPENELS